MVDTSELGRWFCQENSGLLAMGEQNVAKNGQFRLEAHIRGSPAPDGRVVLREQVVERGRSPHECLNGSHDGHSGKTQVSQDIKVEQDEKECTYVGVWGICLVQQDQMPSLGCW